MLPMTREARQTGRTDPCRTATNRVAPNRHQPNQSADSIPHRPVTSLAAPLHTIPRPFDPFRPKPIGRLPAPPYRSAPGRTNPNRSNTDHPRPKPIARLHADDRESARLSYRPTPDRSTTYRTTPYRA